MAQQLFFDWLILVQTYVAHISGRKDLLLHENCSARERVRNFPMFRSVRVELLHPNTTSKVLALDTGVIAWLKAKFQLRLFFRVFECIEGEKK